MTPSRTSVVIVGTIDPRRPDPGQSAVLDAARSLQGRDLPEGRLDVRGVLLSADPATASPVSEQLRALGRGLHTLLSDARPDVVHTVSGLAGLAALSVTPRGSTLVHSPLGRVVRGGYADDIARLERLLLRESTRVVAASNAEAELLISLGLGRGRVAVVPYAVDSAVFRPDGPARPRPADRRRVVTLSRRLDPASGMDDVVRALRGAPGLELVVAGGPPAEHRAGDPDVQRLHALARQQRVDLQLLGCLAHAEVPALLRSADLLVVPPRWGATGAVAIEAMACGCPVVTAAMGADAEAVVEGATGVVVDPGNADELRRAVLDLLADPMRRDGYRLAARARVTARHDWDAAAARLVDTYRAARPAPPATAAVTAEVDAALAGGWSGARHALGRPAGMA